MSEFDMRQLPPLPESGATGPQVCAIIQHYLAVEQDLEPAQLQVIDEHVSRCPECAHERAIVRRTSQMVGTLKGTNPSAHVDHAVREAIAMRRRGERVNGLSQTRPSIRSLQRRGSFTRRGGLIAAVAVLVLALASSLYFMLGGIFPPREQAFALPADLEWKRYVLYQVQTRVGQNGERYQVRVYHDMSDNQSNIEFIIPGKMDIMVVKDQQKSLGLDMMHNVAKWDVEKWNDIDLSMYNLPQLRKDLESGKCKYSGKGRFNGQEVYRIRYPDGHVLLLDRDYMPVNVLAEGEAKQAEQPMYDTIRWLQPSEVSETMWRMEVPEGFTMGELPPMP